jgi:hypothetical protein
MTAPTLEIPPDLDALLARAVARTLADARDQFVAIVARRVRVLDRPLTDARFNSIVGAAWAALGVRPRATPWSGCRPSCR